MADISRADAAGTIPVDYSNSLLEVITANSVCLTNGRVIRVGTNVNKFPVLATLPTAGFVEESATAAGGLKPTTELTFTDKTITVEEVAAIVPIHENVLEDSTVNMFQIVRDSLGSAFAKVIDAAILFGTGAPTSWEDGVVTQATDASQTVELGTGEDIGDDLNTAFGYVETAGYPVNGVISDYGLRGRLRGLRSTDGSFLYSDGILANGSQVPTVFGAPYIVDANGSWDATEAVALMGDMSKIVVGLRSDMNYKVLTEASLTVGESTINLAQRDMVALRVKMRLGWALNTVITPMGEGVPFSVITPEAVAS